MISHEKFGLVWTFTKFKMLVLKTVKTLKIGINVNSLLIKKFFKYYCSYFSLFGYHELECLGSEGRILNVRKG